MSNFKIGDRVTHKLGQEMIICGVYLANKTRQFDQYLCRYMNTTTGDIQTITLIRQELIPNPPEITQEPT